MNILRLGTLARFKLFMLLASLLMLVTACEGVDAELLAGILQNIDSANGEITIVTKDGKTVTLTIATEAPVDTEGASSALETLESGASVEIEVSNNGQLAQRIKARQAKVEGVIIEIAGNEITVESEGGRRVMVTVSDGTRIELEDELPGIIADLQIGAVVDIKFDPDSQVAFKIDAEEEEAEIEGLIVQVGGDEVTIETERGRRLALLIAETTRIELEDDFPGTKADLQVGAVVEAKFDPFTRTALKFEVEEGEQAKIEGVVVEVVGDEVTVVTESGSRRTLTIVATTRIELDEDFPGTKADIQVGVELEAKFDPITNNAFKVEVKKEEAREAKIKGVVVEVVGDEVTIETERGHRRTLIVLDTTQIELEDDFPGTRADIQVGVELKARFDPFTRNALKVEIEEAETEEAEIEGVVVEVVGDEVTIETERGHRRTLIVLDTTQIELEDDVRGTKSDLQVGVEIEVSFDPVTLRAFKVEVEEADEKEANETEIEGTIVVKEGNVITVDTEDGRRWVLTITDGTRIELGDDLTGTLADLRKDVEVNVRFDPDTDVILKIELEN